MRCHESPEKFIKHPPRKIIGLAEALRMIGVAGKNYHAKCQAGYWTCMCKLSSYIISLPNEVMCEFSEFFFICLFLWSDDLCRMSWCDASRIKKNPFFIFVIRRSDAPSNHQITANWIILIGWDKNNNILKKNSIILPIALRSIGINCWCMGLPKSPTKAFICDLVINWTHLQETIYSRRLNQKEALV